MSYDEPTGTYKTSFRFVLPCRDERNPRNKISISSAAAAAAAAAALAVARAATTPKTWPWSTPKITETGDASRGASPRTIQTAFFFFWSDSTLFGPTGALLDIISIMVRGYPRLYPQLGYHQLW